MTRAALIARWAAASHRSAHELEGQAPLPTPPANLQHLAAAELSSARYHLTVASPPARPSLWAALWQWVQDRWNDLWRAAFGHVHFGRGGAIVIGDVLLTVVVILLIVVSLRLLTDLAIERRKTRNFESLQHLPDATALYAAACEQARRADFARASALLFAATVAVLVERGAIRDDRSATVGELRRCLRVQRSELVAPFDGVASAFVTGAYAERPVTSPDWERARTAYGIITAGASP